jgi:hypothetical protein
MLFIVNLHLNYTNFNSNRDENHPRQPKINFPTGYQYNTPFVKLIDAQLFVYMQIWHTFDSGNTTKINNE